MSRVDYPDALPCPQVAVAAPLERRALSTQTRPRQARALQRDRGVLVNVTWPPMNAAQMTAWREWWSATLIYGASPFNASWPLPEGVVDAVWQFLETPRRSFVPGGRWIVSAQMEVRGVNLPVIRDPLPLFLLHLDGDLVDEIGATYAEDGPLISAPTFVASSAGFDQQATFPGSGNVLARALYPSAQRFVDASEWQLDAFVTVADASGLARTVIEIAGNDDAGAQRMLLWVNFTDVGDAVRVELDVRVRTGAASVAPLSVVDTDAARVPAGDRVHVRVTQRDGIVNAYLSGTLCLQRTGSVFTAIDEASTQVTIGAALSGFSLGDNFYSSFMDGQIDEVRLCHEVTDAGEFDPPVRPFTVPIG